MSSGALGQLMQAYLHEDWSEDYDGDAMNAVDAFVIDDPEVSQELVAEIADLLRRLESDDQLEEVIQEQLSCGYYPPADGWTYREWLTAVADRVQQALADS